MYLWKILGGLTYVGLLTNSFNLHCAYVCVCYVAWMSDGFHSRLSDGIEGCAAEEEVHFYITSSALRSLWWSERPANASGSIGQHGRRWLHLKMRSRVTATMPDLFLKSFSWDSWWFAVFVMTSQQVMFYNHVLPVIETWDNVLLRSFNYQVLTLLWNAVLLPFWRGNYLDRTMNLCSVLGRAVGFEPEWG